MKDKKAIKNIILFLVLAVLAVAAYAGYTEFSNSDNQQISTNSLSSLIGSNSIGQIQESTLVVQNADILRILGSIQGIQLNDEIFSNPVFKELKDSRFTIPKPPSRGRINPFRPIGIEKIDSLGDQNQDLIQDSNIDPDREDVNSFFGDINN